MKVLITTNIPAPYFVRYASELSKYVDLTVAFELTNAKDREKQWIHNLSNVDFNYIFLNGIRIGNESGLSFKTKKIIKNGHFDKIIIANPTTPTGIITILYCKRKRIPFCLQSEGGFPGTGRGLKEKFKKRLMSGAELYFTGMGENDEYFLLYGAKKELLRPYNFCSSYKNEIDNEILPSLEKAKLKKELNIKTKYLILYIGQFIPRKGIDLLLKAFKGIDDATLCLIGGKPTDEYLALVNELNIANVLFLDFKSKQELSKYYHASDVFVMLTREDVWGLVINEAMEHGLPIITTNRCNAGRFLVEDNVNGFLIETNNYCDAHSAIQKILSDNELMINMSKASLKKIKDHTIENMAKTIYGYLSADSNDSL